MLFVSLVITIYDMASHSCISAFAFVYWYSAQANTSLAAFKRQVRIRINNMLTRSEGLSSELSGAHSSTDGQHIKMD